LSLPFPDTEANRPKKIKTEEWMPAHDAMDYPKSFVRWVDSINKGWRNKLEYKPFTLYCQQAELWIAEEDDILNYATEEEQADYIIQEYYRCRDNSLYFCNKYGKIKEGDVASGMINYKAWDAQELIVFFFDCGYSCLIGKARQVGFTTTMGLIAQASINFHNSYFAKFVTHSKDKGEEIFRDKIQWGFGKSIPSWLRHKSHNFSATALSLEERNRKTADIDGASSRIEVVTPAVDAINGGSPQVTLVDEIGLFEGTMFSEMVTEGRPTLFFYDPETSKMKMKRQLFAWGTGGEMKKGGAAFEIEFKATLKAWRERDFKYGIIPLFFDAYARNGVTKEVYEAEKRAYYSKGPEHKVKFHQHYPITIDDMFSRDAKTIIPLEECNRHLNRIYNLKGNDQIQYGYFEPVFDQTQPTPDGHYDFRIKDAVWVPSSGMEDERTTACIFKHPPDPSVEVWKYRYYQGIDPINSETGHSKMSGAIWDSWENTISSVVFWRVRDYKECYLQCILQGIYYDREHKMGVPELIESNIGANYQDIEDMTGFGRRQVPNKALPPWLQTPSSSWWGIANRANTAGKITNQIIEMMESYSSNIFIPWIFLQLKTFVEKDLKSTTGRQTRYQAADMRYDHDDVIFSSVFAYINAKAHSKYEPEMISGDKVKKFEIRWVQTRDTNFELRKAKVNISTNEVVRYLQ
jgi:hypothetical protein